MECLDDNVASEFVSGGMPHSSVTKVERHLAGCRDCRELVAALAGADDIDSNARTHRHERDLLTESQAGRLPALSIGDRVGRYLVLSTLGTGGMGQVFAAYDPQLDRKIALKVLRANLGANAKEARARLKREAQAIAQLNHPNVVAVYDVGTTSAPGAGPGTNGEDVYIAMEFIEGDTLTTWLKRWPRTWREILEVFRQAARGLIAAHSVGLLHRDFKPDNVLVGGDGRVRVTDFGLARSLFGIDDSGRGPTAAADLMAALPHADGSPLLVDLTATGTVLGTPRYMPPEQLMGPNIDARSDQFSFCVALYEALYGMHPLLGSTSVAMLEEGKEAQPPPDARLPTAISRAVMRGLAKDRTQRFPTMAALVTELTPPAQHAPGRGIAIAVVGLIVIGVATAAVMASHEHEIIPDDRGEEIVHVMIGQIRELENSNKALRKQLLERDVRHEDDIQQIELDKQRLAANDELIHELTDKVTALRMDRIVPKPKLQAKNVIAAVALAQHDLEGCFDEWAERPLDSRDVGRPDALVHTNDSDVLVALRVGPDGVVMQLTDLHGDPMSELVNGSAMPVVAQAKGPDTDRSASLKFCVEHALAGVTYPKGPEIIDLEVAVTWTAPNIINTSARVTGHREPPAGP
ncbi:MAG: serine/threonine-protein kinase [Kofleriaceae bacterium]